VKPELSDCLNKWGGAVTTDMWTECYTQASYITVTAHYISCDWNLTERVLATREFDPDLRHTGANIKQVLTSILDEFGVDVEKVIFVTDRGANMLAAMKNFKQISCADHMLNTVLTHLFEDKALEDCPGISSLLSASKQIVRYFKKTGLMRHLPTSLKQEVCTRWNTMFYLLESVLKNLTEIEHILQTRNEMFRMTGIDKKLLENLVAFLEVFRVASVEMEATKVPTLHLPLPWYHKIVQNCEVKQQDVSEMTLLKSRALQLVKSKFILEPVHHVASVLNPKMKNLRMLSDEEKERVYNALRAMLPAEAVSSGTSEDSATGKVISAFRDSISVMCLPLHCILCRVHRCCVLYFPLLFCRHSLNCS